MSARATLPLTSFADLAPARLALRYAADLACIGPAAAQPMPSRPAAETLRALPVAEVREQLDRLLLGRHTPAGLDALNELGVLDAWLPEVAAMVGFGDFGWRHKDVWAHSKQVVWQSVPRLAVRWGALLHDIGKVKTRRLGADGQVHFLGHAEVGAAMFRKRLSDRLQFDAELGQRIHFLILQHLRGSQYDGSWTDAAVRRFAREMGDGLDDLLKLSRADITTKRTDKRRRALWHISDLSRRVRTLALQDSQAAPLPKGLGNAIAERFGIPPSKRLGELRNLLADEVEAGRLPAQQPAEVYLSWLAEHREPLGL